MKITRTIAETRAALARREVGLVPTMGAYHAGHLSLFAAAREENDLVVASLFVNPAQFGDPADLARYPRDETADAAIAEEAGVDVLFAPRARGALPARLRDLGRRRARLAGSRRRPPPRPLPGRRDHLPEALQRRPSAARLLRPEGRAAGRGRPPDDPRPRPGDRAARAADRSATPTGSRSPPGTRSSPPGSARQRSPSPALSPPATRPRRGACSTASTWTTSRSRRSTRPSSPPPSASAPSA